MLRREKLETQSFQLLLSGINLKLTELELRSLFLLFSRDKKNLDKFVNEERIELLLKCAALIGTSADKIGSVKDFSSKYIEIFNVLISC